MWVSDNWLGHALTVICKLLCSTGFIMVQGMFQSQRRSMVPAKVDSLLLVYTVFFCINNMKLFIPVSMSHPASRVFRAMSDTLCLVVSRDAWCFGCCRELGSH